jgi:hypothetical protein
MTATYDCIATTTLSSAAAEIQFTSISGTFTDLVMVISGVSDSGDNIFYRFNSVNSSSYSRTDLIGNGTSALSGNASNQNRGRLTNYGYPSSTAGNQVTIWQIFNYANTTTYKTSISRSNAAGTGVDAIVNLFSSTSAITSISIATNAFSGTQNWQSGTTVTLYGIKAE